MTDERDAVGPMEKWVREHTRTTNAEYYNIPNLVAKAREQDAKLAEAREALRRMSKRVHYSDHALNEFPTCPWEPCFSNRAILAKLDAVQQ